jgi:hypothetical protein
MLPEKVGDGIFDSFGTLLADAVALAAQQPIQAAAVRQRAARRGVQWFGCWARARERSDSACWNR